MQYFDHPLSERVRSFLRMEHLFSRFNTTMAAEDKWSHHVSISALFEILESASRADLKLDILKELEQQRQYCSKNGDQQERYERLQEASANLQEVRQKFGQHIRENEWLMALKQRMHVPGGTTPVELPGYNLWQKQDAERRRADLVRWSLAMVPTYHAVSLLLEILRSNSRTINCEAINGHYQANSLAQNIDLLIIGVEKGQMLLPEVSANKYFTHIRFLGANQQSMRGAEITSDIDFTMAMCSFQPNGL